MPQPLPKLQATCTTATGSWPLLHFLELLIKDIAKFLQAHITGSPVVISIRVLGKAPTAGRAKVTVITTTGGGRGRSWVLLQCLEPLVSNATRFLGPLVTGFTTAAPLVVSPPQGSIHSLSDTDVRISQTSQYAVHRILCWTIDILLVII